MARHDVPVLWTATPQGHDTTRTAGWQYTVYPCHDGWAWSRERAYQQLDSELRVFDASSRESARQAVEEYLVRDRWR